MSPVAAPTLRIDGSYNARVHGAPTAWLVRSATLDTMTPAGADTLTRLGVALIVDLRDDAEVREPSGHDIPILRNPLYRLPDGPPMSGALERIYDLLLETRGSELANAVRAVADAPGPVLVHCTAGKDRTGLVVALALEAAGASRSEIIDDYVLSEPEVHRHRAGAVTEILDSLDLDPASRADALRLHLDSPAAAIEYALDRIAEVGGASAYLVHHGLTTGQLERLRAKAMA